MYWCEFYGALLPDFYHYGAIFIVIFVLCLCNLATWHSPSSSLFLSLSLCLSVTFIRIDRWIHTDIHSFCISDEWEFCTLVTTKANKQQRRNKCARVSDGFEQIHFRTAYTRWLHHKATPWFKRTGMELKVSHYVLEPNIRINRCTKARITVPIHSCLESHFYRRIRI